MAIISDYNEQDNKPPSSSPVSAKPFNETKVEEVKEAMNAPEAMEEDKKGPLGNKITVYCLRYKKEPSTVGLKGQPPIIDGEPYQPVKVEDCFWSLEDQKSISVLLTKKDQMYLWKCVVKGEPELDTEKVESETSRLSELDPEIRSDVEKNMFDQRQKAMGRPTIDDMQKEKMVKTFMAQYPWMDFSRAKTS